MPTVLATFWETATNSVDHNYVLVVLTVCDVLVLRVGFGFWLFRLLIFAYFLLFLVVYLRTIQKILRTCWLSGERLLPFRLLVSKENFGGKLLRNYRYPKHTPKALSHHSSGDRLHKTELLGVHQKASSELHCKKSVKPNESAKKAVSLRV